MMMRGLAWYYVTRLALVVLWLIVATAGGLPLWASLLPAAAMIALFAWLPRSGRYAVHKDQPLAPLQRDERSQAINNKAATWAFKANTVLLGLGILWSAVSQQEELELIFGLMLAVGVLTYLAAREWLIRRS